MVSRLSLFVMFLTGLFAPIIHAQQISRLGQYQGYSEVLYDEWVRESLYVVMRDGVQLAVDIFRPSIDGVAVEEPMPVVWTHTPYRRAFTDANGNIRMGSDSATTRTLLRHGYVVALVDTRGRGASQGWRRGFQDRTEAYDAHQMTEWFAMQPWSNGNIGITGCSYTGGSTFHAASIYSPHLKAIAPGFSDYEKYSFISRGGIMAQFNTRPEDPGQDYGQGVLPVDADPEGLMRDQALQEHLKSTIMADLWREIPYRDSYSEEVDSFFWQEVSIANFEQVIENSGIGIFIWGSFFDEGSFEATLAYNNLDNPKHLWMGGWGHCQTADFPMDVEMLRFFDFFLKEIDNGWSEEDPVNYHTNNADEDEEWRSSPVWPPAQTETINFLLKGDAAVNSPGTLRDASQPAITLYDEADSFKVNYNPVCQGEVDMYFLFWPCLMQDHGLAYQTAAMSEDTHLVGHPLLDLWISASQPDTDIFVYLEDVASNGEITIVSHGRLRASHRAEHPAPYDNYMGLPYHRSHAEDIQPMQTGEPSRMRLELLPLSYVLKADHRLQLRIAGADARQRFRTVEFEDSPLISIFQDGSMSSQMSISVLE
jgi:putative CocE/NonD family hydrolase